MYIVCWTTNRGKNELEDFFTLHESTGEAMAQYETVCSTVEGLHCAAVSKVMEATEPHWVDV